MYPFSIGADGTYFRALETKSFETRPAPVGHRATKYIFADVVDLSRDCPQDGYVGDYAHIALEGTALILAGHAVCDDHLVGAFASVSTLISCRAVHCACCASKRRIFRGAARVPLSFLIAGLPPAGPF